MINFIVAGILIVILVILILFLIYGIVSEISGAPFVPSNKKAVKQMIAMANLQPGEKLLDLGSGDGRIVFAASKTNEAYGVDVNRILIWWSNLLVFIKKNKNAHFLCENIFNIDLSQYDVLTLYCLPKTITKLEDKMQKEMKPTAKIISNTFELKNAKVIKQEGKVRIYSFN